MKTVQTIRAKHKYLQAKNAILSVAANHRVKQKQTASTVEPKKKEHQWKKPTKRANSA